MLLAGHKSLRLLPCEEHVFAIVRLQKPTFVSRPSVCDFEPYVLAPTTSRVPSARVLVLDQDVLVLVHVHEQAE